MTAHATVGTAPTLGLSYRAVDVEAGKQAKITIEGVIPAGTTFSVDYNSIPKTWAATVDPKGTVTLTPPKDATGAHKIGIVAEHKGTKTFLEIPVTVTPAGTSVLQRGSATDNGKPAVADTQRGRARARKMPTANPPIGRTPRASIRKMTRKQQLGTLKKQPISRQNQKKQPSKKPWPRLVPQVSNG